MIEVVLSGEEPRQYAIVVESGLLTGSPNRLGEECRVILPENARLLVVTDTHLAERYLPVALESLKAAGFTVTSVTVPAGEASKSLEQAQRIYEAALTAHLSRTDAMLGLGGGVIGDLTGFCASTYHRGIGVIHVPTTLVAQVDSAIGGKTAVNAGQVKNGVGTFHQPLRVLADPTVLSTLPERERVAGMAEVLKYGLIETSCTGETGFFETLSRAVETDGADAVLQPELIRRCAAIKAAVVMQDETETRGLRFYLNLGHTFGHAYESLSRYQLLHGETVGIGLLKAAQLACLLGDFPPEAVQRLTVTLSRLGLAEALRQAAEFPPRALLDKMKQDKKNTHERIRLVLPTGQPGQVRVRDDIPEALILQVLAEA
jgi:3-dehydroquinate synthase